MLPNSSGCTKSRGFYVGTKGQFRGICFWDFGFGIQTTSPIPHFSPLLLSNPSSQNACPGFPVGIYFHCQRVMDRMEDEIKRKEYQRGFFWILKSIRRLSLYNVHKKYDILLLIEKKIFDTIYITSS